MVSFTGQEVQGRIQLLIIKQKNSFLLVEMVQKSYYPYPSDKPEKKYFIITSSGKRVYFGQQGYNDYIIYNRDDGKEKADKMKRAYIARHSKMGETLKLRKIWYRHCRLVVTLIAMEFTNISSVLQ